MALFLAIVLTVIASSSSNIGKAFQKEASRHLPPLNVADAKIVEQYQKSPTWITGFLMDLCGGALQTFAFALAPVSLLQPISGIGLAGLALYSHFVANEKLKPEEWVAVGIAGLGTLGLATSSSDAQAPQHHSVSFLRMLTVLTATGIFVISKMTHIREHRVPRNNKKMTAAMYGLQAGGMFGLSASTVRTGFIMSSHRWTWAPFGVICGVLMSSYGFVLQTGGLKEGSAVIVCTCLAVSSMFIGVFTGICGLGEPLPLKTFTTASLTLASWSGILYGVIVLSGATKQVRELVAVALDHIPASIWLRLPEDLAVKIKNWITYARADTTGSGPLSPKLSDRLSHTNQP